MFREKLRIWLAGGTIKQVDETLAFDAEAPPRVFSRATPEKGPAIAMSRSIGDTDATRLGVTPYPSHRTRKIDLSTDRFIVMASDGLWEVFENREAVDWIVKYLEKN